MKQPLNDEDRARYEWQMWVENFGCEGQERLKGATVLVTRVGGVGGMVAHQLAAAGVGRLILAHAGELRPSDLNRQLLMSSEFLGESRVEQAAQRLRAFNPLIEIMAIPENIDHVNVERLVAQADIVASCAPRFEERMLLNAEAVKQRKPLVDAAMFELEIQLTTIVPGRSPCLACLYPEPSIAWKREFPVFGAVAGTVGSLAALEVIKCLAGLEIPLLGKLLVGDLRSLRFRTLEVPRATDCPVCAGV